ncbi:MAG: hypothetical protein HGJ94_09410 [Desulfosarcina sp.]|nr:hypothetical protein [Desulfosarcina sp.]MBC2742510.1 hypothetical protein [Desulfosarcina sp.]MBC2765420.1 hypothetical protein [Desulfosarcina sp.]
MDKKEIIAKLSEIMDDTSFIVAYSKVDAEPLLIFKNPKCDGYTREGEGSIPKDVIENAINREEKVDIKCTTIFHAHNSPGCQILTASGRWVCVCCR